MAKKKDYQVTIGYYAVIHMDVSAENDTEAIEIAKEGIEKLRNFFGRKNHKLQLTDDKVIIGGTINYTDTWYKVQD